MKVKQHGQDWLEFDCPGCSSGNYPGTDWAWRERHTVNINPNHSPCWGYNGDGDRPTLTPSVHSRLTLPNGSVHICHFFVRAGQIHYCTDSTHALAGKVVDMMEVCGD